MRLSRREWTLAMAAGWAARLPAAERFQLAICNETFQGASLAEGCRLALETGYTGVEIAPWTLSEDPASIPAGKRAEYRQAIKDSGVGYVGLHSLLTAPRGELHITTPDAAVREKSWDYFRRLVDLCADLGDGGLMILGSGKQRGVTGGATREEAMARLQDGLAALAPHAAERGVVIMPEPLAPHLCDVLNTMAEAVAIVEAIDNPGVRTMFDTHNAVAEALPHGDVIRKYAPYIEHVHLNELDGRHPGAGSYDFGAVLEALREIGYSGWLSVEVFHFEPSGEQIAREAAEYLRGLEAKL